MRRHALVLALLSALCLGWLPEAPTAFGTPEPGPRLVVSELAGATSTLWAVDPADPRRRQALSTVEHAEGWGLRASTSPNGRSIAYMTLPAGARDASQQAELWLLDTAVGAPRRLSSGLDLLGTPVWEPDSSRVVVRRTSPRGQRSDVTLVGYPVSGAEPHVLAAIQAVDWAGAIGWWQGHLVYASIDGGGSYLHWGETAPLLLTTGIARDFQMDPATRQVSYATVQPNAKLQAGGAVDLITMRAVSPAPTSLVMRAFGPHPGGDARYPQDPLGASSDGRWTAAVVVPPEPAPAYLAVVGAGGVRPIAFRGHVEYAGWLD